MMGAGLNVPPAIVNGFRIGNQPNALGTAGASVQGMGFDAAGNLYLAGTSYGVFAAANRILIGPGGGSQDLFVIKLSASREILNVAQIGGSDMDALGGMAVDCGGNVFLAGQTASADFPTTAASYQPKSAAPGSFLIKLDPSGRNLVYSTYIASGSAANSVAVDDAGNAYVGGSATAQTFPTTAGAYQRDVSAPWPFQAGFVSEFSADGRTLLFSTLLSGSTGQDFVQSLALDANGVIHVSGRASSNDFPTTPGANRTVRVPGSVTAFLARLDPSGSRLLYSALLPENQNAEALAVDREGNSYVAGEAVNLEVTRIDAAGAIIYAKTFAGSQVNSVKAVLASDDGTVMLGGTTISPDFPTRDTLLPCVQNLPQEPFALATFSGFFMLLDAAGNITHSSLLGGVGYNNVSALARAPGGGLYVAGATTAPGFPVDGDLLPTSVATWLYGFELDMSRIPRGRPAPSCLVSGATYAAGPAVPGAVMTLYGSNLGSGEGMVFSLDADGRVPADLGGIHVTAGGLPAPVLYAQDRQFNFVAPQLPWKSHDICVSGGGVETCIFTRTAAAGAGVFGNGTAVRNEDGTPNTPANPAARGSVITFYGTGFGPYGQSVEDGSIAGMSPASLRYAVVVDFIDPNFHFCNVFFCPPPAGPFRGTVTYAGQAPGMVAGVTQVNVRIPEDAIPSSRVPVTLGVRVPELTSVANAVVAAN